MWFWGRASKADVESHRYAWEDEQTLGEEGCEPGDK